MKRMIVDTANLLFRVAAAQGKYNTSGTVEERAGLSMHMALNSLNKFYKKYKPDQIAVTFEGSDNWRKAHTRSAKCVSKRVYKANRVKDDSMIPFFELIKSFEDLVRNHTALICLSHPSMEGDDIFAGYVQRFADTEDEIIGISGDKDFVQLLKYKNFTLINPDTAKPRTLLDVCGQDDAAYFMFEKAFRGDAGDNVMSAYPRVQKKRLLKCLSDDYELTKIMNETWTFTDPETQEVTTYKVSELFEENNLLMNLECQPPEIRAAIEQTLDHELMHHGKYSHFQFTKFCGKYGLKQIAENAQQFANLFSATVQKSEARAVAIEKKKSLIEF
jgi:hypothetical protein